MTKDVDRLRRDVSLPATAEQFGVRLQEDGNEYVAPCPFHAEDTPSFTIFTGQDHVERYHCFGCGERGDVLDFVQKIKGVGLKDAIKILDGGEAGPNIAPRRVEVVSIYAKILPLAPASEIEVGKRISLYNPKRRGTEWEWGKFTPSMVFPYRREDGSLIGYVLRRDLPEGKKETPMVMWVRLPDGKECWCRFPFPKPRPLYGLDRLREGQVIVNEGEKCRDALAKASGRNVVTWPGGTYGIEHTDWTPLRGRNAIIWPDNDGPGIETAHKIAARLHALGCSIRIMDVKGGAQ